MTNKCELYSGSCFQKKWDRKSFEDWIKPFVSGQKESEAEKIGVDAIASKVAYLICQTRSSTLQSYKESLLKEIGDEIPEEKDESDVRFWLRSNVNLERQRIRSLISTV